MKYTIKYVRGYWVLHDGKGRLVALASQCARLINKLQQWKLKNSVTPTGSGLSVFSIGCDGVIEDNTLDR
jgi:hypothetical protein